MDEIISPKTVKVVKGEGMPICDNENQVESLVFDNKKGDLYIIFNIKFPDYINSKKKEKIIKLLTEK
jgi:DnaJ-class molecular chaperone